MRIDTGRKSSDMERLPAKDDSFLADTGAGTAIRMALQQRGYASIYSDMGLILGGRTDQRLLSRYRTT